MVGFYQKLIPHFAYIVFLLREKIKNNPKVSTLIFNTQLCMSRDWKFVPDEIKHTDKTNTSVYV